MELNSGNLGSWCKAVIAVLQGLMSSKVELVQGVMSWCDRFGTSQDFSEKYMSVMGCNNNWPWLYHPEKIWTISEVEFALEDECAEFSGFETIKLVEFLEFGFGARVVFFDNLVNSLGKCISFNIMTSGT